MTTPSDWSRDRTSGPPGDEERRQSARDEDDGGAGNRAPGGDDDRGNDGDDARGTAHADAAPFRGWLSGSDGDEPARDRPGTGSQPGGVSPRIETAAGARADETAPIRITGGGPGAGAAASGSAGSSAGRSGTSPTAGTPATGAGSGTGSSGGTYGGSGSGTYGGSADARPSSGTAAAPPARPTTGTTPETGGHTGATARAATPATPGGSAGSAGSAFGAGAAGAAAGAAAGTAAAAAGAGAARAGTPAGTPADSATLLGSMTGGDAATTQLPKTGAAGTAGANPGAAQPLRTGKKPRRARLVVRRIDPWSVLKFSLLFSICLLIVFVVAVAALYYALDSLGVFDAVNQFVRDITQAGPEGRPTGGFDVTISPGRVIGGAAVLGAINVVIITAISTLAAFLYNLCSDIVGGIEVTLAERD